MLCSCQTKSKASDEVCGKQISVYGEVIKPLTIYVEENMSVPQAIQKAGLMKQCASRGVVVISRKQTRDGQKYGTKYAIKNMRYEDSFDEMLQDGDTVVVLHQIIGG